VKIYRSLLVIYANAYGALPVTVIYPYEVRAGLAVWVWEADSQNGVHGEAIIADAMAVRAREHQGKSPRLKNGEFIDTCA